MTKEEFIGKLTVEPTKGFLIYLDQFSERYDKTVPFEKVLTDFFLEHPNGVEYYWWCWDNGLPEQFKTKELINHCALGEPEVSLSYYSNILDAEVFKQCVLKEPEMALIVCPERLKRLDEVYFNQLVLDKPQIAIAYCSHLLERDVLNMLALEHPTIALRNSSNILDESILKKCALKEPQFYLIFCPELFDEEFLEEVRKKSL